MKSSCQNFDEYVPQGYMYCLREQTVCSFIFKFRDSIDGDILKCATKSALNRCKYFALELIQNNDKYSLVENKREINIYEGRKKISIPEETNGYLFSIHYWNNELYFEYDHFLSDGRGIFQFITEIFISYINQYYKVSYEIKNLPNAPFYDRDKLISEYLRNSKEYYSRIEKRKEVLKYDELAKGTLALSYREVKEFADKHGGKVFSVLILIFYMAIEKTYSIESMDFSYAANARQVLGVPEALYNCVTVMSGQVNNLADQSIERTLKSINDIIVDNSDSMKILESMAYQMNWLKGIEQLDASNQKKKRIYKMGERLSFSYDLWFSFIGDILYTAPKELENYISDLEIWVPSEASLVGAESFVIGKQLKFCFVYYLTHERNFKDILKSVCNDLGLSVVDER